MKILVVNVAGLGYDIWKRYHSLDFWDKLNYNPIKTVFPAVTCTVQASFRTGLPPEKHGMISNGLFNRKLKKAFFWEQASTLYEGNRIWEEFRNAGNTVGQLCWQQAIGNDSDLILTPAPIHKHHGGMIQDFYARPDGLYHTLCKNIGTKFNLFSYWGPFTSSKCSSWINNAAIDLIQTGKAADLQLVYLPHLDYEMQKSGPFSDKSKKAFLFLEKLLDKLIKTAHQSSYEIIIFGDYAITEAKQAVFPNRILKQAGLFKTRKVKSMLYPDIYSSPAFAMVDHQVAHIFISDKKYLDSTINAFKNINGIKKVHLKENFIDNPESGEVIIEASNGHWFAYPWWNEDKEAPDYASHVDIHNKPGFDPCELFLSMWPPMSVSMDTSKVHGTHGSTDEPVFWGSSFNMNSPETLLQAVESLKNTIDVSI